MTKTRSEAKAVRTYVALRDNTTRFYRDEITYTEFHAEQIRLWDAVDSATTQRVLALLRGVA